MGRKGRRRRKLMRSHRSNVHHLLFQKANWEQGYGLLLRRVFTREVPVSIHNELHHDILHTVPVPEEELLRSAWNEYQRNRYEIDAYGICDAIKWLYDAVPDKRFRQAMKLQWNFFAEKMKAAN
jgi:hypothetical protein